uniref:Uncharacterized protein n=1 Tax=Timema bartmani TaxID=61472 RepID=A0A7R9EM33_9NEOP|nr:unnamed protein product [Timema bartmani]
MIYPPNSSGGSGGGVGCSRNRGPNPRPGPKIRGGGSARSGGGGKSKQNQQVVQWKQRNVQEGIVLVDEAQLSKLIKREPIHKYYDMDPEPFAKGKPYYSSPMASLVLSDSSQLTADGFEKLPDQIMSPSDLHLRKVFICGLQFNGRSGIYFVGVWYHVGLAPNIAWAQLGYGNTTSRPE